MPFYLIKGSFHVTGYQPDGDSVKFAPENPALLKKLTTDQRKPGIVKINKKGHIQLRIEAIDAPETHYLAGSQLHQPWDIATESRKKLLDFIGINDADFGEKDKEVVSATDNKPGYILARYVDNNQYGRPVSFAFAGTSTIQDGSNVRLTPAWIKRSLNYKMLEAGMAYPTFYTTLFYDLRQTLTEAVRKARNAKKGIWAVDKSKQFTFNSIKSITEENLIFPKLFRRLSEHINKNGGRISTFIDFLADKKDALFIMDRRQYTDAMDTAVAVKGKIVRLQFAPENILFVPQKR
jgi:endonuclease YncB( thermonuclease family)